MLPLETLMHLRMIILRSGLTQKELASRMGVSRPLVSQMISFKRASLQSVTRLADVLGYDLEISLVQREGVQGDAGREVGVA